MRLTPQQLRVLSRSLAQPHDQGPRGGIVDGYTVNRVRLREAFELRRSRLILIASNGVEDHLVVRAIKEVLDQRPVPRSLVMGRLRHGQHGQHTLGDLVPRTPRWHHKP
jgi:hypothetical protein